MKFPSNFYYSAIVLKTIKKYLLRYVLFCFPIQVETIRFELYNGTVNHIHMSIDGNRWKHPLPIEDDNKVIEIYHSGKTSMFVNSNSKCKFKELE